MPLEINELVIKLSVKDSHQIAGNQRQNTLSSTEERRIIEQCVDRVLKKIETRKER
ncbi:DUF5908 family protein [Fulvivirga aurantia]|uniref:DUF5908 family protein n=1 Tax=Fulvivirga aurantia TaxID=2529383 RepID=UPI0012BC9EDE|nr:DUF5908 family protein [Fulvivirga aurantia]